MFLAWNVAHCEIPECDIGHELALHMALCCSGRAPCQPEWAMNWLEMALCRPEMILLSLRRPCVGVRASYIVTERPFAALTGLWFGLRGPYIGLIGPPVGLSMPSIGIHSI